jgi:hypothetical protein
MRKVFWFVTYKGNHTGKYYNEVVGICENEDQAVKMLDDLVHEDLQIYNNIGNGLDFEDGCHNYEYRNGDMLYSYKVTRQKVFVNFCA